MSSTPEVEVVLRDDRGEPYAEALLTGEAPLLRLARLRVRPDRRGEAATVGEVVRDRARAAGASVLSAVVAADDPEAEVLAVVVEGSRLLGEHLSRAVRAERSLPAGFGWRPLTPEEYAGWRETQVEAYAGDNLERTGGDLEAAREKARTSFAELLPEGLETPDNLLVVLTLDGDRIGHLWLRLHRSPGEAYVYDVEVAPGHRGRGLGRAAMDVAEVLVGRAGDETIGLHVFGFNTVARRLYRSQGFTRRSATYDLLAPAAGAAV